jgi:hypothetical protein
MNVYTHTITYHLISSHLQSQKVRRPQTQTHSNSNSDSYIDSDTDSDSYTDTGFKNRKNRKKPAQKTTTDRKKVKKAIKASSPPSLDLGVKKWDKRRKETTRKKRIIPLS